MTGLCNMAVISWNLLNANLHFRRGRLMDKTSRKIFRGIAILSFCTFILLPIKVLFADENKLTGEPFSDPGVVVSMPKTWQEQALQYNAAIKNADLVVNLDQSETPLLAPIIEKYSADNGINIIVTSGTCGVSNRNLLSKSIDIGSFCCPPGTEDRLPDIQFHTLGITPLAIIVHPDNPIEDITFEEAQKIFMGEIQRWQELKNAKTKPALPLYIQPITFIHCKNRPGHWRLLLNDEELFSVRIRNVTDIPAMIFQISTDKNAIGYEIPWLAKEYYKKQGEVKILNLNGVDPEKTEYLLRSQYPLYRVYNLTTWSDKTNRKEAADKLIQFLKEYVNKNGAQYHVVSSQRLRQQGWQFKEDELVGPPEKTP